MTIALKNNIFPRGEVVNSRSGDADHAHWTYNLFINTCLAMPFVVEVSLLVEPFQMFGIPRMSQISIVLVH